MTEALLTVRDVARLLNVSERTVFRLLDRGEITGVQLGGGGKGRVWRFAPSEVDAYVERQRGKREEKEAPQA
jgi:excisionase family DNA binding protein